MNRRLSTLILVLISALSYGQTIGTFGGNGNLDGVQQSNNGGTTNKWVKLAELTLNGNYYASGITVDLFPKNGNHGDSRQQLSVQFRNTNGTGIYQSTYDISLIHFSGQHKSIKDVKVVHTSGTLVSNNKLSVWVQMGVSWLAGVPIEVRTYGNVVFETTNQPYFTSIPESGTVYDLQTYYGMSGNRFSVAGKIRAEEINVETGWADYVFEDDYNLMPLSEIDSYIKENGHLPEVPTTKEVEADGVNLGEMNMLLLKKIEELTLHLIKKDLEVDELRTRIESLENK